jgi:hemerythrin
MPIVEWNEGFCLGIEQFDREHKRLVDLINSFYDACNTQSPVEILSQFFDELAEYAGYHFQAEEQWMKAHEYLKFAEHRKMHQYFMEKLTEMRADFAEENKDISLEMLSFLMHWLRSHIMVADADYVRSTPVGKGGR